MAFPVGSGLALCVVAYRRIHSSTELARMRNILLKTFIDTP